MQKLFVVAAAVVVASAVAPSWADSVSYDSNVSVPPGWFDGTGNPNGGFTVETSGGIELGLRAKYRSNPAVIHSSDNNYSVVPGEETNVTSGGNGAAPGHAAWNYEFSINLNPTNANSGYLTLSDIVANLTISDSNGHSQTVNALTYWNDDSGWNGSKNTVNSTTLSTDWIAQQSENPEFADFPLAGSYDVNAPGVYTFKLDVSTLQGSVLASDTMTVTVVPLPSAAMMGVGMLGLVAGAGLLRKKLQLA